jgi:hypothetical protein
VISRRRQRDAERLRHVIDCLPFDTRVAMLDGIRRYDRIIVGAYSDRSGGVCPMLAAHRCGGRTDFRTFARAWDRFTGVGKRARRASEREVRTLSTQIEASIWREQEMRAEVTELTLTAPASERDRERTPHRRKHEGAWLLPFRRWDGYRDAVEAALHQLRPNGQPEKPAEAEREEELVR